MKKITALLIALAFGLSSPAWSKEAPKKDTKPAAVKPAEKKKATDPKWKNNSLAKKQAECKADPSLPKCAKKKSK